MENPTIKTIAKAANVSTATVSKALNDMPDISEATKTRIRGIARDLGYTINENARQLASGYSRLVGIILPDITRANVARGYQAAAARILGAGYGVHLTESGGDIAQEAQCAREMLRHRACALIILPASASQRHFYEAVRGSVPIIFAGGTIGPEAEYAVLCEDFLGGQLAARHIYRAGHRRCVVLTAGSASSELYQRSRGFIDYMQRHRAYVSVQSEPTSAWDEATGEKLALQLAGQDTFPTALFATDDLIALGAMSALRRLGLRVPEDISVVGYGDSPCARLSLISLTTVRLPVAEMAICAADMVVGAVGERGDMLRRVTLEPQLVRRSTVKKIAR